MLPASPLSPLLSSRVPVDVRLGFRRRLPTSPEHAALTPPPGTEFVTGLHQHFPTLQEHAPSGGLGLEPAAGFSHLPLIGESGGGLPAAAAPAEQRLALLLALAGHGAAPGGPRRPAQPVTTRPLARMAAGY